MNVLLIDDPADIDITVRAITTAIPSVVHAVHAPEAIGSALRTVSPDVILSNHAPPRYDAVEVLRVAGDICPGVPLIVMLATPDIDAIVDCFSRGAADVVGKPTFGRLRPAIIAALSRPLLRERTARADASLRLSEQRFRDLAENFPGVLYLRRNDHRYSMVYLNEAVEKLTGYPRTSFLDDSMTLAELCHPDDQAGCDGEIDRAIAARGDFCVQYRLQHRTRGWRWIEERGVGIYQGDELRFVEGFLRDVTEPRAAASRLTHDATHDGLTGLVNRVEFERRLERAVLGAKNDGAHHAFCYLDLDGFKRFNDEGGHSSGDALLRQVARTLLSTMRSRDTVARLGGDEFGLLLEHCSPEQARTVAVNLLQAFEPIRFSLGGGPVPIGISIGVAPISPGTAGVDAVIRNGDAACYLAKRQGGSCVHTAGDPDDLPRSVYLGAPRVRNAAYLALTGTLVDLTLGARRVWSRLSQRWLAGLPRGWRSGVAGRPLPVVAFDQARRTMVLPISPADHSTQTGVIHMFYVIAVILFVAWLLGFGVFHVGGNLIHALLVIALIVVVWRLLTGRRPMP